MLKLLSMAKAVLGGEYPDLYSEGRARTTVCAPQGGGFKVNTSTESNNFSCPLSWWPPPECENRKSQ